MSFWCDGEASVVSISAVHLRETSFDTWSRGLNLPTLLLYSLVRVVKVLDLPVEQSEHVTSVDGGPAVALLGQFLLLRILCRHSGFSTVFCEHHIHKGLRWSEVVAETTAKVDAMQCSSVGFHGCRGFRAQMFLQVTGGLNKVVQSETRSVGAGSRRIHEYEERRR